MMMKQQFSYPADTKQTYSVAAQAAASGRDMQKLTQKFQQMQQVQLLMQKNNHLQMKQQLQMVNDKFGANRKARKSKSAKRSKAEGQHHQASSVSPARINPGYQSKMEPASAGRYMDRVEFEVSYRQGPVYHANKSDSFGKLPKSSIKSDTRKSASTDKRPNLKRKQTNALRMSQQAPATGASSSKATQQNKQSRFHPAYSTANGLDASAGSRRENQTEQRSRSPIYRRNQHILNNKTPESDKGSRRNYNPSDYDLAASSADISPVRQVNTGSSCMDLEAQIQGKIKDLEHKYTKANQIGSSGYEMNIEDDESEQDTTEAQDATSNRRPRKERIQAIKEATLEESSNQNSASEAVNVEQVSQSTVPVIRNCEQMDQLLGAIPAVDQRPQDHNDQIQKDIVNLIENFERVFVAYINDNYRSFTERDLQRLIREELKQNLQVKLRELKLGQAHSNCDPFKIQSVLENAAQLKATNEEMRESMHKVGVAVNQLAKTSFDLKNENFVDARMDKQIRDIAVSIDTLNHLFNDVHLKVLQNDNELNQIEITCSTTLSSHGHLRKFDELEKLHKKLDSQHQQLKQQLFDQTCEYKQLQNDYDALYKMNQMNENDNEKVRNMEQMLQEVRTDNKEFIEKIEQLQAELFGKDREIDKMKHQLKHGVIAKGISPTFDHSYAGRGGSIASGTVQSKLELASDQAQLLSQAQNNLMSKDQVDREKQIFEACKRDLEQTMKSIKAEIDETELSVLKQGAQFMEPESQGASNTMENIKTFKNMLTHQARALSPQPRFKRTASIAKRSRECQTDFQEEAYRPTSAPSISHYKPQELIRLEVENNQLKSELETLKLYQGDLEANLQHMTECLKESKTAGFLLQQSALRQQKMAEQQAEKHAEEEALTFGDDENQGEPAKKRKRNKQRIDILDEFESDLLNVKQSVKETEELIKESKKNTFSQSEVKAGAPIKKRSYGKKEEEEAEDPKAEEERLMAKMNELVKEKDQNILELTVERQRQDGVIEQLQAQVAGLEQQIKEHGENVVARAKANRDDLELERARSECKYLAEKVDTSQRAIERLEEQLKMQSNQQLEEVSATLASSIQNYNNLQQQLDEERHESTVLAREIQDLQARSAEKSELYVKLQTEFNELCRAKVEQERQMHDLRESMEKQLADERARDNSQVEEALRSQLRHAEDELLMSQEQNGQLQREISSLQLQHRDLKDQFDRSDKIHEREKLEITTQYQAEIMQITENIQKSEKAEEIRELQQTITNQNKQLDNYVSRDRDQVKQIETLTEEIAKQRAAMTNEEEAAAKQEAVAAPITEENDRIKDLEKQLARKDKEHSEHTDSLFEKHKKEISSLQEELGKLQAANENQFGSNNSIRQLLQAKIDELQKECLQKSSKIEQVELEVSKMDALRQKLKENEAQILEQMQAHLRNEVAMKAKAEELERAEEALKAAENEKRILNQKLKEHGDNIRASEGSEQKLHENIRRLGEEKDALTTEHQKQISASNNQLELKQREIERLGSQLDQKTQKNTELESELGRMESLKQKLQESEAKILEQMQTHLKNEMELKDRDQRVESQIATSDQLKNRNTELEQQLADLKKAISKYEEEKVKQNFEVKQLESEKRTLKEHLQVQIEISATKLQENHEASSKQIEELRTRLAAAELLVKEAKTELDAAKEQNESLRKEKEAEAAAKEDDFWSRPSRLDDSMDDDAKAGLNSEDNENLAQLSEQIVSCQNQLDEAKDIVLNKIKSEFQEQIDKINQAKTKFINEAILAKAESSSARKLQSDFSNDKIKQVQRITAGEEAFLVIQNHVSLEEHLASTETEMVYLVKESNLDSAALSFLTGFVPGDDGLTVKNEWLEQFEQEIAKLKDESNALRQENAALNNQIRGLSDLDDENEEMKAIQDEQLRASKEVVALKQQNNELQKRNVEERKRIHELNSIIQNMIQTGNLRPESESNQNEQQISYGKNFHSLFGESSIKMRPSEASAVTVNDVDLSRGENFDQSSGEGAGDNTEVLQHLKSNLQMYLSKTPILDSHNETNLQILFSMLHFTKQEISDLEDTRAQLPIYKIDEKSTKKAQKQLKANERQAISTGSAKTPSDPQAAGEPLSAEATNLKHSLESGAKTKFAAAIAGSLFGRKSKTDASDSSFGRADVSQGSIEERKSPAPVKMRKTRKGEEDDEIEE